MKKILFTSESVTEGHPDKICDQISDAVLDEILKNDPEGRVACETIATTGLILVMGEISTTSYVDVPKIVRRTLKEIGYTNKLGGFDCDSCAVITTIDEQSNDIAMGVDSSAESKVDSELTEGITGAGDQGMMFGFACNETKELMPMPISLAHAITKRLAKVRKEGILPYLGPDGKAQVTVAYEDGTPAYVDTIVVSAQHAPEVLQAQIKQDIIENVINVAVPNKLLTSKTKYYINPTGRFVIGGPQGDSGLTGRKIIVDTYGGYSSPTKVDRSAAYMARYAAKNIVASGLAQKCEIQVSYAIGVAKPVSIMVDTFGTGKLTDEQISELAANIFDFRPDMIIKELDLRKPIYRRLAAYGHMGREDLNVSWERLDKVEQIKEAAAKLGCILK